jgi:hypothetical protein
VSSPSLSLPPEKCHLLVVVQDVDDMSLPSRVCDEHRAGSVFRVAGRRGSHVAC